MAISDKLNYLIETKNKFKDRLNSLGAEIIESTTFRKYLTWLDNFYNDVSLMTGLGQDGIEGVTSQDSTTGKNLYVTPPTLTINGVTFTLNNDGTYNITGTATGSNANDYIESDLSNFVNGDTYTLSATKSLPAGLNIYLEIYNGSTWTAHALGTGKFLNSERQSVSGTFSSTGGNKIRFTLRVEYGSSAVNISNLGIQLEKSSSATDFEPYTGGIPSPNPDFPQEIKNRRGDLIYKVRGKNLFIPTLKADGTDIYKYHADISISNDKFIFNCTGADMCFGNIVNANSQYSNNAGILIPVKHNTTYSVIITNNLFTKNYITKYDSNKTSMGYTKYESNSFSFSTDSNTEYISFRLGIGDSTSGTVYETNIQISEGNLTEYEPYVGRDFPVSLPVRNLFDVSTNTNGKVLASDGTITNDVKFTVSDYIKVTPNTSYTISWIYDSALGSDTAMRVGYFQSDKTFISRPYTTTSPYLITTPNNCYYIIICYEIASHTKIQIEQGSSATSYEPYRKTPVELADISDYKDRIFRTSGKNLFDKNNANIVNLLIGSNLNFITSANATTVYVPIQPNTTYTAYRHYYDSADISVFTCENIPVENGTATQRNTGSGDVSKTVTTSATDKYLGVYIYYGRDSTEQQKVLDGLQIEEGSSSTTYEPYGTDEWWIEKKTNEVVLNGSEDFWSLTTGTNKYSFWFRNISIGALTQRHKKYCNNFTYSNSGYLYVGTPYLCENDSQDNPSNFMFIFNTDGSQGTTVANWKTWLSTHNTEVEYVLATPTYTKITEENYPTLYGQLKDIQNYLTSYKINKQFILDYSELTEEVEG